MKKILIDTCAWIDFLRSKQGAKGNKEKQQLELLFSGIDCLDTVQADWVDTGLCLQNLRSKGITLPVTDALIAIIALRHAVPVLTIDKHFDYLSVTGSSITSA